MATAEAFPLLGQVARRIAETGTFGGIEIGFFGGLAICGSLRTIRGRCPSPVSCSANVSMGRKVGTSFLTQLQTTFAEALKGRLSDDTPEEDLDLKISETVDALRKSTTEALLKNLKRRAPAMLRRERRDMAGFEKRTFERWTPAFDLFEIILVIIAEVGAENDAALRPAAIKSEDWRFEAISHLHARGLLVAREIYSLLRSGFPDGALARWRTLHELTVTAMFLRRQNAEISFRYLASFHFQALRAARQLDNFAERARMEPFAETDLRQMEVMCSALEQRLGDRLRKDYDWATPGLGGASPTFDRIELAVGMDHWRPRYRWASQHNHGGHRPLGKLLGMSEALEPCFLVGASNSGFVDPLHMSAISLIQLFATFLFLEEHLDRIVIVDIVQTFVDELGDTALAVQKTTLQSARVKKKRKAVSGQRRRKTKV